MSRDRAGLSRYAAFGVKELFPTQKNKGCSPTKMRSVFIRLRRIRLENGTTLKREHRTFFMPFWVAQGAMMGSHENPPDRHPTYAAAGALANVTL